MKRVFLFAFVICAIFFRASGQEREGLMKVIQDMGSATVSYSMSAVDGAGKQVAESVGSVDVFEMCYRLTSDEIVIASNGIDRWLYSPKTQELVITKSDSGSTNPMDNPLLFLNSSKVIMNGDGSAVIRYPAKDGVTYIIYVSKIIPPAAPFATSHFIIDPDTLGDEVIVTDLR